MSAAAMGCLADSLSPVGETIAIPLDVEYHWPDIDKSVATGHKTVYAQKGIVVRVQVPEEVWAGESRPIYAVLNGKYNDGASKCGDVPWTYDIAWQFAEPVWEEEGSGEDITYTPRPPETAAEYVPSQIMTGAHRLKHDTSPLYVGDMTCSYGGLVYVRAIIKNVRVNNGEVVQTSGTLQPELKSAWITVQAAEEILTLNDEGYEFDDVALSLPMKMGGYTVFTNQDYAELLSVTLPDEFDPNGVDVITAGFCEQWDTLEETGENTLMFTDAESAIRIVFNQSPSLSDETLDALDITVTAPSFSLSNRELQFLETGVDTRSFLFRHVHVTCSLQDGLSSGEEDLMQASISCSHSPESLLVGTWDETAPESREFHGKSPLDVITIAGSGALDPGSVDVLTLHLSLHSFGGYDADVTVTETSTDSKIFESHIGPSTIGEEFPDLCPQNVVRIGVKRWPGVIGDRVDVYVVTSQDTTTVQAQMSEAMVYGCLPPILLITPLIAGVTEVDTAWAYYPEGITVQVAKDMKKALNGSSLWKDEVINDYVPTIVTTAKEMGDLAQKAEWSEKDKEKWKKLTAKRAIKPLLVHACALVADPWVHQLRFDNHDHMRRIREKLWNLGYCVIKQPNIHKKQFMKLWKMEAEIYKKVRCPGFHLIDIWYIICETNQDPDTGRIWSLGLDSGSFLKPAHLDPAMESWPRLVYINSCASLKGLWVSDGVSEKDTTATFASGKPHMSYGFYKNFHCVRYVGNIKTLPPGVAANVANTFFENAQGSMGVIKPTVHDIIKETNSEHEENKMYYASRPFEDMSEFEREDHREFRVLDKFKVGEKRERWWKPGA